MTRTQPSETQTPSPHALFALIAATTVLGIAGTDLVLPAVPGLPAAFGTTIETAQMVLAAYALGTMIGLLAFGELGARLDPRRLLVCSLGLFTLASLAAILAPSIGALIALRFAQGAFGAAPAVFAPGFIRGLFHEDKAAGALGRLGSIESLTPALAPIAGAFLLALGGWRVSFVVIGGLGIVLTAALLALAGQLPGRTAAVEKHKSYGTILMSRRFMRYAISQSFGLGGLLVFVFGMPAVITGPLGLGIGAFVAMQVIGITAFIVGANLSSLLARRFGTERIILAGSAMLALAFVGILILALIGARFELVIALWIFVNFGFGIRGPIGFNAAIVAAEGDHSRGAALVVAAILATAAIGTALVAPFLSLGLLAPALAGTVITGLAVFALPALRD